MAKRISGYFARFEEAKRKFEENQNKPKEENDTQNSEDLSAERLFSEVWSQATPAEVMLEFLWFKKWSGVKLLLDSIQSDLVEQVRLTLKIDLQVLQLYESKSEAMNICQDVNLPIPLSNDGRVPSKHYISSNKRVPALWKSTNQT